MHCIWDFNGTLLNDAPLALEADNIILAQMNMPPITMDTYRAHVRNPIDGFYVDIGCDLEKYAFSWINDTFLEYFNPRVTDAGLIDGAIDVLRALASSGHSHSILSSSYEPVLLQQAEALGLMPYMRAVTGLLDNQGGSKELRGMHQLRALQMGTKDTVIIGDTVSDAFVANHMGIDCILVSWGHNSRARLEACGVPLVDTLEELVECIAHLSEGKSCTKDIVSG